VNTKEYIESGILEAYMLGALTPQEKAQVEADIARYPELKTELNAIEGTMQQYWIDRAIQPPVEMQEKIWKAIQSNSAGEGEIRPAGAAKVIPFQPEYRKTARWKYAALWAGLAGSLLANVLFWGQAKEQKDQSTALEYKIDTLQNQQKQLSGLVSNYTKATAMMADTAMQTIVMHTMQKGHPMAATLYWSKDKGLAYVAMDALPQPPKGMQYQLWVMQEGKPVDMGVLPNSMANTPEMQKVPKLVSSGEAFAISLEKEGGSPTPTMQNIYVMGKPS
jgi:anti-sigma-K factor RskA